MLVIEHNPAMRRALRELLQCRFSPLRLEEVGDDRPPADISFTHEPGVVVLDAGAAELARLAPLASLRARLPDAVIVVLTHAPSVEYARLARADGADACVDKDRIYEDLAPAIERARSERAAAAPAPEAHP